MRMKIWYLSAYDQPNGHSSRTFWYASELAKRGHQVTMLTNSYCHFTHVERLTSGEKWKIEQIEGVRVVWLKTIAYEGNGWKRAANMLLNAFRCLQFARQTEEVPDVVIGPSVPIFTGLAASKVAKSKGAAFVYEVRDIWPQALVDLNAISSKSLTYFVFRFIEKILYKNAVLISAVLPLTYKHVEKSGGNPDKVTWIPNGVNLTSFDGIEEYDGGLQGCLTAMYVGGFSISHDVITILKAAKILQDSNKCNYQFILVGGGKERGQCEALSASLGLDNVKFIETVPKRDVPALQSKADILIASVKDTPVYQFGINSNKLFDYLGSARPILFSGNAPNDPVAESHAGLSIPPENPKAMADALIKLYEMTPTQRVEMGQLGRKYAEENFDLIKLVDRMEKVLWQAVNERNTCETGR
jgi:glycosyltransferase involved in cell wall biosynthesis